MNQEKIGKFIAECRKKRKMTQSELGEKLGVTEKSISNWENGRNMPDLSLFKPLCKELNISLNDLLSGEVVTEKEYQEKFEENIINTIDYSNKKIENRNNFIGLLLMIFGVLISITAVAIFPSESSWGSIYAIIGGMILTAGIYFRLKPVLLKRSLRIVCIAGCAVVLFGIFTVSDYIAVSQFHQVPRFSYEKSYGEDIVEHKTLFYTVIQKNPGTENENVEIEK